MTPEYSQVPGMYMLSQIEVPKEGTEIWRALIKQRGDNQEYEENLEYEDVESVIQQLVDHRLLVISSIGLNGAGKGAVNKGWMRIIEYNVVNNQALRRVFRRKRLSLNIHTHPFALYAEASKLPGIDPSFAINPNKHPANYDFQDTNHASLHQWFGINQSIEKASDSRQAVVIIQEGSIPLAIPESKDVPIEVAGLQDLGFSSFCNAALDKRIKDGGFFYILDRPADDQGKRARDDALLFRQKVADTMQEAIYTFKGLDQLVINIKGREIFVRNLPEEYQKQIKVFLLKTMAPPAAIVRNERMLEILISSLTRHGLIENPSNNEFFKLIRRRLDMEGNNKFSIMMGKYAEGTKIDDLEYFLSSHPAKTYPELLEPIEIEVLRNLEVAA